jgi:carboxylesterase type B
MTDPTRLVLESIALGTPFIAVNLNYRLNLFGFAASTELLNDQTHNAQKGVNFGLHDQKIGIEWVSKNIYSFGGDPSQITLGGQSAGAASVHAHTMAAKMSPATPPFRRVIMQSGSMGCLGPVTMEISEKNWNTICQHMGLEKRGSFSRVDMLRGLSAEELLKAQKELGWVAFPVTIDGVTLLETDIGASALVHFGDDKAREAESKSAHESIEVMVGDTENEVRYVSYQFFRM